MFDIPERGNTHAVVCQCKGLSAGAQRSGCLCGGNGCLNPGLISRHSGLPNKYAHVLVVWK